MAERVKREVVGPALKRIRLAVTRKEWDELDKFIDQFRVVRSIDEMSPIPKTEIYLLGIKVIVDPSVKDEE